MPGARSRASVGSPWLWIGATAAVACAAAVSCGSNDGGFVEGTTSTTGSGGGPPMFEDDGYTGPPGADASGYCGNDIHHVVTSPPNIVFVFDTSGSMATLVSSTATRYSEVRSAALDIVRRLGALINVGVVHFPANPTDENACTNGAIVMPVTAGDPYTGSDGPTTQRFIATTQITPLGGTPLASTIESIKNPLSFLPGKTILVLATDGGPNCNAALNCDISECGPNIEGQCDATMNCCAPGGLSGPEGCVDSAASVQAVTDAQKAGLQVYVVGIPGSEVYAKLLAELAIAGGSAQPDAPYYYAVEDLSTLGSVFGSIAAGAISCDFVVTDPPDAMGYTNVYLDQTVLPEDPTNGWSWTSSTDVELHGAACAKLKAGQVKQVQIVSGCPTVVK